MPDQTSLSVKPDTLAQLVAEAQIDTYKILGAPFNDAKEEFITPYGNTSARLNKLPEAGDRFFDHFDSVTEIFSYPVNSLVTTPANTVMLGVEENWNKLSASQKLFHGLAYAKSAEIRTLGEVALMLGGGLAGIIDSLLYLSSVLSHSPETLTRLVWSNSFHSSSLKEWVHSEFVDHFGFDGAKALYEFFILLTGLKEASLYLLDVFFEDTETLNLALENLYSASPEQRENASKLFFEVLKMSRAKSSPGFKEECRHQINLLFFHLTNQIRNSFELLFNWHKDESGLSNFFHASASVISFALPLKSFKTRDPLLVEYELNLQKAKSTSTASAPARQFVPPRKVDTSYDGRVAGIESATSTLPLATSLEHHSAHSTIIFLDKYQQGMLLHSVDLALQAMRRYLNQHPDYKPPLSYYTLLRLSNDLSLHQHIFNPKIITQMRERLTDARYDLLSLSDSIGKLIEVSQYDEWLVQYAKGNANHVTALQRVIDTLEEVLPQHSLVDQAKIHERLGHLYMITSQTDKAIHSWQKMRECDPATKAVADFWISKMADVVMSGSYGNHQQYLRAVDLLLTWDGLTTRQRNHLIFIKMKSTGN